MKEYGNLEKWEIIGEFKDKGTFSRYTVSNFGRIYDLKQGKYLLGNAHGKGYHNFGLYNDNKELKIIGIHQVVMQKFGEPNPDPKKYDQVGHLDENPENNHISNLYWTNAYENNNHGLRNARISYTHKRNNFLKKASVIFNIDLKQYIKRKDKYAK